MRTLIALMMLAGGTEYSHPPGVNGVDCWAENAAQLWVCKGACWYGKKPDGGTYGKRIDSTGRTEAEARENLAKQCPKP